MARLLVVDDDPAIAKFVRRGMEADGHVVSVTSDAPSAVRLVQESEADVAIVDIVLPEIAGRKVFAPTASCRAARPPRHHAVGRR